jgi:peptide-methionine (S)-S-oxide reductase
MQKEIAERSRNDLEKENVYNDSIVTEITPFKNFYVAEDYHKNYYEKHQDAPYCNFVIDPFLLGPTKMLQEISRNPYLFALYKKL